MTSRSLSAGDSPISAGTSRRALLRGLTIAPVATSAIVSPWCEALASLHRRYDDEPASLARSKEGRSLSRVRYHNAERSCWLMMGPGFFSEPRHAPQVLHQAGFVLQQALCAYLLDCGSAWKRGSDAHLVQSWS